MIAIKGEIDRVAAGEWPASDNPLVNAPHTAASAHRRLGTPVHTGGGGLPGRRRPGGQVLAAGPAHRRRLRRPHLVCACPPVAEYA